LLWEPSSFYQQACAVVRNPTEQALLSMVQPRTFQRL
jgi:hypothetical protein